MTLCLMTADYKVCLVPVTCKLLLDNCGEQRLFSAREIQRLRGEGKVRSLLRASGVQTFPGDTQIVWRKWHTDLFGESEASKFLSLSARCFISFRQLHWLHSFYSGPTA
jgi:hypothetical protein